MQELDKNEIYYVGDLTANQLEELTTKYNVSKDGLDDNCIGFSKNYHEWWYVGKIEDFTNPRAIINATTLFKHEIKKGQVWEHIKTGERVEVESISVDGVIFFKCGRMVFVNNIVNNWKLVEDHKTEFKTITDSIASLLEYKNEKYGNAALEPLNIFTNKTQVGQRIDDKLARIKNSDELRKNDVADLIGYLLLECKFKGWDNFDEFKD